MALSNWDVSSKESYVYILISSGGDKFKIGKADNVHDRYKVLKRHWGSFNIDESFQIRCPHKEVYNIEKILHFLFDKYNLKLNYGDGYTEWFDYECLSEVESLLESMIHHRDELIIEKIEIPEEPEEPLSRPKRKVKTKEEKEEEIEQKIVAAYKESVKNAGIIYKFLYERRNYVKKIIKDEDNHWEITFKKHKDYNEEEFQHLLSHSSFEIDNIKHEHYYSIISGVKTYTNKDFYKVYVDIGNLKYKENASANYIVKKALKILLQHR